MARERPRRGGIGGPGIAGLAAAAVAVIVAGVLVTRGGRDAERPSRPEAPAPAPESPKPTPASEPDATTEAEPAMPAKQPAEQPAEQPVEENDGSRPRDAAPAITGARGATKTLVDFADGFDASRIETHGDGVRAVVEGGALRVTLGESRRSGVSIKAPAGGWDASAHVAVDIDVVNVGDRRVALLGQLGKSAWIDGFAVLGPGEWGLLRIFIKRKNPTPLHEKFFEAMRGLPGGHIWHWVEVDASKVGRVTVAAIDDSGGGIVEVRSVKAVGAWGPPPEEELAGDFFPFVDVYGQYRHGDWPRKIRSDADLAARRANEERDLGEHPGPAEWNRYGGWAAGPRLEATGHFRTQKLGGKWWLVDPEGRLFWSHGIDCVRLGTDTRVQGRERYFAEPEGGFDGKKHDYGAANQRRKYGEGWEASAVSVAHARLRSWGMNTVANWSQDKVYLERKTPYVVAIHYVCPQIGSKFPDVRRPEFRTALRKALGDQRGKTADDPWCIGYFIDNELRWPGKGRAKLADTYYRTCRDEMKRVAPNKLYLGSRLHSHDHPHGSAEDIVRAAAKYCDVIGLNRYRFSPSDLRMIEGIDVPLVIGEFHFGAMDRGMLHTGLRSVADQKQRGRTYVHYVTQALRHPHIVGTHWFQYRDQVVTGRGDGENYQIGFIDICETPYVETVEAAREVGSRMYEIRAGCSAEEARSLKADPAPKATATPKDDVKDDVKDDDKPETRVLFIGNSYTGGIKGMVEKLVKAEGIAAGLRFIHPGGRNLVQHSENPKVAEAIRSEKWDFVVLQDQSQTPAYFRDRFRKGATALNCIIREGPARVVFYMTWGRRDGDKRNLDRAPDYETMQKLLTESYETVARELGAGVAPVGRVWREVRRRDAELGKQLYRGDGSHPSARGAYVAAVTFAQVLFNRPPASIKFTDGLGADEAKLIRDAAAEVLKTRNP